MCHIWLLHYYYIITANCALIFHDEPRNTTLPPFLYISTRADQYHYTIRQILEMGTTKQISKHEGQLCVVLQQATECLL